MIGILVVLIALFLVGCDIIETDNITASSIVTSNLSVTGNLTYGEYKTITANVTGYITIIDSSGVERHLAVVP